MQARSTAFTSDQIARRWRDLADRRRSHFIELYESGRWKHYYTEADFILRMREVVQAAEQWGKASFRPAPQTGELIPTPAQAFVDRSGGGVVVPVIGLRGAMRNK